MFFFFFLPHVELQPSAAFRLVPSQLFYFLVLQHRALCRSLLLLRGGWRLPIVRVAFRMASLRNTLSSLDDVDHPTRHNVLYLPGSLIPDQEPGALRIPYVTSALLPLFYNSVADLASIINET